MQVFKNVSHREYKYLKLTGNDEKTLVAPIFFSWLNKLYGAVADGFGEVISGFDVKSAESDIK